MIGPVLYAYTEHVLIIICRPQRNCFLYKHAPYISSSQVPQNLDEVGCIWDKAWWSKHLATTHPLLGETSDPDKLMAIRNSFYDKTGCTRIKGISLRSFAIFVWHIKLSDEGRESCFHTFLGEVVQSTEMFPIVTPEKVFDEKRLAQWKRWVAIHDSTCEPAKRLVLWHEWCGSTSPITGASSGDHTPGGQEPQQQSGEECPVSVAGGTLVVPPAGAGTSTATTVGNSKSCLAAAAATEATKAHFSKEGNDAVCAGLK